jgi:hypothetical protein
VISNKATDVPADHWILAPGHVIEERPSLAHRYEVIRIVAEHRQAPAAKKSLGGCADVLEEGGERQWVPHAEDWRSRLSR